MNYILHRVRQSGYIDANQRTRFNFITQSMDAIPAMPVTYRLRMQAFYIIRHSVMFRSDGLSSLIPILTRLIRTRARGRSETVGAMQISREVACYIDAI